MNTPRPHAKHPYLHKPEPAPDQLLRSLASQSEQVQGCKTQAMLKRTIELRSPAKMNPSYLYTHGMDYDN
jgi:hypothetical protein